jgi:hypothetical protein
MNSIDLTNLIPAIPLFIVCLILTVGFAHEMADSK